MPILTHINSNYGSVLFNNIELFMEVEGSGKITFLEVKDAWRKVEEEDQVISDCYSIPSNQLIVLLPFLKPYCRYSSSGCSLTAAQPLSFFSSSLLLTLLFICRHLDLGLLPEVKYRWPLLSLDAHAH